MKTTPLMEQYSSVKKKYPDAILFFRMGDFYEMFYDDAQIASDVLGLTLTSRAHGKAAKVPLAGFPYHSVEQYLSKMLKAGHKVAICEQIEDPKKAKGIVKRAVTEVITPGTATSENVIEAGSNNYLLSLCQQNDRLGMAGIDVSTGEFFLTEGNADKVISHAESLNPKEILHPIEQGEIIKSMFKRADDLLFTQVEDYYFSYDYAHNTLIDHFNTVSLKGFGSDDYRVGVSCAGASLKYLQSIQNGRLGHVQNIKVYYLTDFMVLDYGTRKNLELVASMNQNEKNGSLLAVMDHTVTKMGTRLLKSWLLRPLLNKNEIQKRLQAVDELYSDRSSSEDLSDLLKKIIDIERITSKINTNRANGRDIRGLGDSLRLIPEIRQRLEGMEAKLLKECFKKIKPLKSIANEIDRALSDTPPISISDGGLIRDGYNKELDDIRNISKKGKKWILDLQAKERTATGIPSLRINYNKIFGYYIEVTKTHLSKVPEYYIRKQTLVNAERYITPEMKEQEDLILNAQEKIFQKEQELFQELRLKIAGETTSLQTDAAIIAKLDVFCSLAKIAADNGYCKPEITNGSELHLVDSRHPVVEKMLPSDEPFIPNDHEFGHPEDQIHIITGPNMAGKSTFLRQIGLSVLMAQIGSFVPARKAKIGIVDRIFTRVGAHDDVSRGESTFLVEMNELANIINNSTDQSLLLLDEIGRGTSTFDGLSIAWATVEYLHGTRAIAAKTLFATHYHEITAITQYLPKVRNYHVQVKEWEGTVLFLRKILAGTSDHSYGIHVAQMAGIPPDIILRAREILTNLESMGLTSDGISGRKSGAPNDNQTLDNLQISLFNFEETLLRKKLNDIDPDTITPKEAIQVLFELKQIFDGKRPSGNTPE